MLLFVENNWHKIYPTLIKILPMDTNNDKNETTGHNQSDFAGTNTDRYGAPKPADEQDNPVNPQEAQNVVDGERLSGEEAEQARRKANEGGNQGRGSQS